MRKTPIYNMQENTSAWLEENSHIMYTEILEAVESAIDEKSYTGIPVVILQNELGTTLFILKSLESVLISLEKAMSWFVSSEEYEKAARVRDAKDHIENLMAQLDI